MGRAAEREDGPETVVTNYYGAVNRGDAAIALATADALRERLGRAPSTIESWHPRADAGLFDADVVGPLWKPHSPPAPLPVSPFEFVEAARKLPYLGRSLLAGVRPDHRLLRPHERRLLDRMARADLVVGCGGGYLHDVFGPVFLRHLYTLKLATMVDTPVYLNGQSIGPFRRTSMGRIAANVLSDVDYITLRDPRSAAFLSEIGVDDVPVEVTADNAFLLDPRSSDRALPGADGLLVGATVRRWAYPGHDRPGAARDRYRDAMAACFDHLVESRDASVCCFSHAVADVTEARRIARRCAHPDRLHVLDPDLGPRELKALSGEVDAFVGTRMHSTVFATAMGTPTVCISYLPKARTVMDRLDVSEYAVDIGDVSPTGLRETVDRLLSRREAVANHLKRAVPVLESAAERNAAVAAELIDGAGGQRSTTSR